MGKRTRRAAEQRHRERPWFQRIRLRPVPIAMGLGALALGYFLLQASGAVDPQVGRSFPDQGRTHMPEPQTFEYNSRPATSGPHWPAPARWGVYTTQLPDERLVHNLEHGGIVIAYNGIAKEDVQRLSALRSSYPRGQWPEVKIVIHPHDKIPPGSIAVAAWTRLDIMAGYDEGRILAFIRVRMGKCCEAVP